MDSYVNTHLQKVQKRLFSKVCVTQHLVFSSITRIPTERSEMLQICFNITEDLRQKSTALVRVTVLIN